MPLASVYPLVSSRAVARAFTYEVPEDVGKGAIVQVRLGRRTTRGVVVEVGVEAPAGIKLSAAGKVLDEIPPVLVDLALWIADYYGTTPARALELVAPVRRAPRGERPSPVERESLPGEEAPDELTPEQETAIARIVGGLDDRAPAHLLLVGPTGSGKTEVYLQACDAALARGRGTIVLVPEIALAPQTVGRFRQRFGDTVAILHSALGQAERRDERDRIARGEARIVVGARSAIFAPMRDLGLVIVDEEHDSSFKQESDPRYDARTVAAKRAALEVAVAVYGSATPRPESWATLERVILSSRIGAKIADLAPTTIRASPRAIRSRSSRRSACPSAEWRIATVSPKRCRNLPTVCGASAISGTSTIVPRPRASAASQAWRYTSVLPLPVGPTSRR